MNKNKLLSSLSSLYVSTALQAPRRLALASVMLLAATSPSWAGPQDGQVVGGSASITTSGSATDIHQSSSRAIIDWRGFDVGAGESVEFHQPSSSAVTLNRVKSGGASQIDGSVKANGNVIIINPNGVFFGSNSRVDVNSIVATTSDTDNDDFMAGRMVFNKPGSANAKIVNAGTITAQDAGLVGLVAPQVENSGVISARVGKVQAASGDQFTLDFYGDGLISVAASDDITTQLVKNSGAISAQGGQIILTAADARNSVDNLVVNAGTLQASTIGTRRGEIILSSATGAIQNTGAIHAKGDLATKGGSITVDGAFVALGGDINADGKDGGDVRIRAHTLSLADTISARGLNGQGGTIRIDSGMTWETSTSRLNVDGLTVGGMIRHLAGRQLISSGQYSAQSAAGTGGTIDISAASTKFLSAQIEASGETGGGIIRLGGEYQGGKDLPADDLPNASYLIVDSGTRIRSRVFGSNGKGGTTILWSDTETLALGTIDVTPGTVSGDGGFVEISSLGTLNYDATVTTGRDTRLGEVLLDPKNIVISDFSFNATALIMGYGYAGGNNIQTNLDTSDENGSSVSLDGTRLVIGAIADDGLGNALLNSGAVYLYNFSDTSFNGGVLEGIIGAGYTGGKNIDLTSYMNASDQFGISVSLDGVRLAVGAYLDDGYNNVVGDSGKVYLFTFADTSFNTGVLSAELGRNYGYNNASLTTSDQFGISVSLNGNRLAVGAHGDDGNINNRTDSGVVYLYTFDNDTYSNLTLQSRIGFGYTGGKNLDMTGLDTSDLFAHSISLDGNMLVVGASQDDGFGNTRTDAGAVYLFTFSDSSFSSPVLQGTVGYGYTGGKNFNLTSLDTSDRFGRSVALDSNRLAVGAPLDDGYATTAFDAGAVYLFTVSDSAFSSLTQEAIIGYSYTGGKNLDLYGRNQGGGDYFGQSVTLDGNRLVVGASRDDGNLNAVGDSGAAYMFKFTNSAFVGANLEGIIGAGYTEGKNINVESLSDNDTGVGGGVAIDGRKVAIGDQNNDGYNNTRANSGAVYLYSFTDDTFGGGILEAIIGDGYAGGKNYNQSLRIGDAFGSALSMDGNRLAVGVIGDDGAANAVTNNGAVYLYQFSDSVFNGITLTARMGAAYTGGKDVNTSAYTGASDQFGYSLSLDGLRLAVGSNLDDGAGNILTNPGAVYLFTFDDLNFTNGQLAATIGRGYTGGKNIDISGLDISDEFGASVFLDGNRLAVGAQYDDGLGNLVQDAGAIYLFTFTNSAFTGGILAATIGSGYTGGKNINQTLDVSDYLGSSVVLSGTTLLSGARGDDGAANAVGNAGAIYRYTFSDTAFTGGTLAATIGSRYTGANDIDLRGVIGGGDSIGRSMALDGLNIIFSSPTDDSFQNNATDIGGAIMMSFTDSTFQTGAVKTVMGQGYGITALQKSINVLQVQDNDVFGSAVSLNGNRLVVGSYGDDGFTNSVTDAGAVFLFSFSDSDFNGGILEGIIGSGYTGGKNIDMSSYLGASDLFGYSVSLDGQMLTVGARGDDGAANARTDSGAVYMFNFTNSVFTGGVLRGIAGYNYTGGNNINVALEVNDYFGTSVALDSNRLAVGARGDDGSANARTDSGAVYLYTFADGNFATGTLRNTMGYNYGINIALEASDAFGRSVSLDGANLAIGATGDDGSANGLTNSGAVYLYSFGTPTTFAGATLQARIGQAYTGGKNYNLTAQLDNGDEFGTSVALDGTRLIVGAEFADGFNNLSINSGGAFLFTFTDSVFSGASLVGQLGHRFTGTNDINLETNLLSSVSDQGFAVSLDGNRMVYGSYQDDYNITNSGTVALISFASSGLTGGAIQGMVGNGFVRGMEISPVGRSSADQYAFGLSLNDGRLAVGIPLDDGFNDVRSDSGAVYLYSTTGGNYNTLLLEGIIGRGYTGGKNVDMTGYLDASDNFGMSVSLNGNHLAVSATGDDGRDNNCGDCGAVYLFNFSDAAFSGGTVMGTLGYNYTGTKDYNLNGFITGSDIFGSGVSLDGRRLAVGARGDDGSGNVLTDSGAVYLFTFADDNYSTPTLQARLGASYTTGKNYSISNLGSGDQMGMSVSLDGRRLAVGSYLDDGYANDVSNAGAVYLFTFTDDLFSGVNSAGIIGYGYTGPNDYNMSNLYINDYFGTAVALQNTVLAVGAYGDDGMNFDNTSTDGNVNMVGAVHLFTFSDLAFNTKALDSTIGYNYTGGKNINTALGAYSYIFGRSLSMDDGDLIIGAPQNKSSNGQFNNTGAAYLYRSSLSSPSAGYSFSNLGSSTVGITAGSLAALLSAAQNVTLQASNDITVASALLVDNPSGAGGTLTLQAGRSISINAAINTDDGNLNIYANEKLSTGLLNTQRDAGAAAISMGINGSIVAGAGAVTFRMDDGAGKTNLLAGDMTLRNVQAGTISAIGNSQTGNIVLNGTLTASATSGTSILLAPGASFINNAGAGALSTTGTGRWLVYSDHQDLNTLGGLTSNFSANKCTYGGSCTIVIPGTGNGLLYQYGQTLLQISVNTSRAYGDANPTVAALQALYSYSGFLPGDNVSMLDVLPTATISGVSATTAAGLTGTITLSGGSDNVYDYYYTGGTLTITKKDLTATWNSTLSKTYGDVNPTVNTTNFTYTGLANGESNSVITATANLTGIDQTTGAGTYNNIGANFTATNYNVINSPVTTLTIAKRNITAAWTGTLAKTFGDANPGVDTNNFTYTGFVNSDTNSAVSASGNFGSVGSMTDVGSYSVTGQFTSANYNVTNAPTTTLAIGKRNITAVVGNQNRIYGDANPTLNWSNVTFTNLAGSDTGSVLDTVSLTMPTATATSNAGTTHAINLGVTDNNYNLTGSTPGVLTILRRDITAAWNAALTKVYGDANPTVSTSNFTYTGLVNGDLGSVITASGDFGTVGANTDIGSYTVGSSFTSTNYNVTNTPNTTLTIGKRSLGVTTDAKSKTYGDADPTYTGSITGLTASDAALLSWVYAPTGYSGNAGTYTIEATATDTLNRLNNYNRANTYNALTVNKRNITAVVGNQSRIYGDANPALDWANATFSNLAGSETGSVLDTVAFSMPTATATAGAGTTHAINLTVTDNNYNLTSSTSGTLSIVKKAVTAAWNSTLSKIYGAANPTVGTANFTYTGLVNGDTNSSITANANFGAVDATTGVGSYSVGSSFSSANYDVTNTPTTTLTIGKRDITAAWTSPLTKVYGDALPTVSTSNFSYTGLVNGDTNAAVTANGIFGGVGAMTDAGIYAVDSAFSTANYNVTNTPSTTLTINKRNITAVVGNQSRIYGDANPTLDWTNVTFTNLAGSETGSVLDTVAFGMPTATATAGAGTTHAINLTVTDNNYNLTSSTSGTLSILKRAVTAAWTSTLGKIYGAANPTVSTANFTYTGLVNGDTNGSITANADFGSVDATTGVGSYTVGSAFSSGNYDVTNTPATTLTIAKRDITAAWTVPLTKIYGDALPTVSTSNFSYTGLVNGDTNAAVTASGVFGGVGAMTDTGVYNVDGAFSAANYNITNTPTTTLTIGKRDITAVIAPQNRYYGDLPTSLSRADVIFSNLAGSDTSALLDSVAVATPGALVTDAAGTTRSITLAVSDNNYNLVGYVPATNTVVAAPLVIQAYNYVRYSDAPLPVFSASYSGFKNGQTESIVSGLTYVTTAPDDITVGRYSVTGTGAAAVNYSIIYGAGIYDILTPLPTSGVVIPDSVRMVQENLATQQNTHTPLPLQIGGTVSSALPAAPSSTGFYIYVDDTLAQTYNLDPDLKKKYTLVDFSE